jgi:hypothetical protein
MGTYPQSKVADEGGPSSRRAFVRKSKGRAEIFTAFDHALRHPDESLYLIGPQHDIGTSSMANWLNPPIRNGVSSTPNKHLVAWLKKRDGFGLDGSGVTNLVAWERARPQNAISQRVLEELHVRPKVKVLPTAEPTVATPDVGHQPLVGPTGIGTFVPVTTDDLLVVKEEALKVKAEAEAVALEATVLSLAIDTIRDWLTDKDKLQLALGRIQSLESQLKNSDEVVKRFQEAKLAANQIHSRG